MVSGDRLGFLSEFDGWEAPQPRRQRQTVNLWCGGRPNDEFYKLVETTRVFATRGGRLGNWSIRESCFSDGVRQMNGMPNSGTIHRSLEYKVYRVLQNFRGIDSRLFDRRRPAWILVIAIYFAISHHAFVYRGFGPKRTVRENRNFS